MMLRHLRFSSPLHTLIAGKQYPFFSNLLMTSLFMISRLLSQLSPPPIVVSHSSYSLHYATCFYKVHVTLSYYSLEHVLCLLSLKFPRE